MLCSSPTYSPGESHCQFDSVERRAFTLVEMLVVIAIIGALMGLLIPAVRSARGSAKSVRCENNLRQIGVGLERYHAEYKGYPVDAKNGYGILTFLLPFLEQDSVFARLRPWENVRPGHIARTDLGGAFIEVFSCPTSANRQTLLGFGRSSYLGTRELFPWKTSQTQVRDGKSSTIAIGETLADHAWVLPGTAESIPPGPEGLFGSRHPEGANFVFCDSSVHFISEDVHPEVFLALCTIAGGETVGAW